MTETEQDLARQIAAHPEWQWMNGIRLLYVGPPRLGLDEKRVDNGDRKEPREGWIPDLADAATIGCLIAMLGDDDMIWVSNSTTVYDKDGSRQVWTVTRGRALGQLRGRTLGEAIARAWLAVQHRD